jgi:hypothetical protein
VHSIGIFLGFDNPRRSACERHAATRPSCRRDRYSTPYRRKIRQNGGADKSGEE